MIHQLHLLVSTLWSRCKNLFGLCFGEILNFPLFDYHKKVEILKLKTVLKAFKRLIWKDVILRNTCFYVFGNVFCVVHFYRTHFQVLFSFNQTFINNFSIHFQISLEHIFCHWKQQKVYSNVWMVKLNSHKTAKYFCN